MIAAAIKYWYLIAIVVLLTAVTVTGYALADSYKSNGKLQEKLKAQTTYSGGLLNQLEECNKRVTSTAQEGAVSYGRCQDLAMNDATKNFDLGVTFGRATCPKPTVSK